MENMFSGQILNTPRVDVAVKFKMILKIYNNVICQYSLQCSWASVISAVITYRLDEMSIIQVGARDFSRLQNVLALSGGHTGTNLMGIEGPAVA